MFTPYEHQQTAINETWRILSQGKKPLIVLPTGAGKTAVAALLALQYSGRVIISCCFISLINQFIDDLCLVGIDPAIIGVLQGDASDNLAHLNNCRVVVAMAQTLNNEKGAEFLKHNTFGLSIADEKHLAYLDIADRLLAATYQVGMTATPYRGDGDESLINDYEWIQAISLGQLIREGKLIDYRHHYYPDDVDDEAFVDPAYVFGEWLRMLRGVPTLGFCKTIDEARAYADYFTAQGFPCGVACDDTPEKEFTDLRARFRAGLLHVIFSVTKIATGFNEPCAKGLLLCRRVRSPALWVQIIGRILRKDGTGTIGKVLDFFNNGKTLPDPREITDWLDLPTPAGKLCKKCALKNSTKAVYCANCGESLLSNREREVLQGAFWEGMTEGTIRLDRPLVAEERLGATLNQVEVARAARQAAFWEHGVDPKFAIDKQKQFFPGQSPVVHSQVLEGAIFGGELDAKQLGAYLGYLKVHAEGKPDPALWITQEVRSEGGQSAIELWRAVAA